MVGSDLLSVTTALLELDIAALRVPELDPSFSEPGEQEQELGGARAIPAEELGKVRQLMAKVIGVSAAGKGSRLTPIGLQGEGDR